MSDDDGQEGMVDRLRTRGERELLVVVAVAVVAAVDASDELCGEQGILLLAGV